MNTQNVVVRDYDVVEFSRISELDSAEIDLICGGINGEEVANGIIAFGGATLAVALAPEALLGAVAVGSYLAISAAAGYLVGDGLSK